MLWLAIDYREVIRDTAVEAILIHHVKTLLDISLLWLYLVHPKSLGREFSWREFSWLELKLRQKCVLGVIFKIACRKKVSVNEFKVQCSTQSLNGKKIYSNTLKLRTFFVNFIQDVFLKFWFSSDKWASKLNAFFWSWRMAKQKMTKSRTSQNVDGCPHNNCIM